MKRLILTAIAAAGFAAVVSAREYISGSAGAPGRNVQGGPAVIETVDQSRLALETLEKLTPDAGQASPPVTFALRSADQLYDTLSPDSASLMEEMASWQIQILNSSDKKVGFIQGRGQPPPPLLSWSGLSAGGEPLPSGFYTARLVWMNKDRKIYATREVSFNLFARLRMPEFAELKLDFRFSGGTPLL